MQAFNKAHVLLGVVLCVFLTEVSSLVVTSLGDVRELVTFTSLAPNLQRFIKHEEKRLKVIHNESRYEDEEPFVIQRIKEFKILHQDLVKNQTVNKDLVKRAQQGHPTSVYVVIRNFVAHWEEKLANTTRYGKRLFEFMRSGEKVQFPRAKDLRVAGSALTIIMTTYNISMHDVIKGNILGHQGDALNLADCYEIAKACLENQLVDTAELWLDAAFNNLDMTQIKKDDVTFNVTDALVSLSKIVFQKGDSQRAISLLEKATELDPEDQILHQLYLQYRFGRDVKPLPSLNPKKMEKWRVNFFERCGNATLNPQDFNMTIDFSRRKCRYRYSSVVPFRRYQEEILNFAPHISVIYDFVSSSEIASIKNSTKKKCFEVVLPGNDKATIWQYKAMLMRDNVDDVIQDISYRIGDVTGLDVSQKLKISRGEPVQVIDYGIAGTCLPHSDNMKIYPVSYMGMPTSNRLATMGIFIGDVKVGGEVVFIDPLVTIKPRKGMAVLHYNYKPDGTQDKRAYVGTCPLAVGENFVLEKGIWSNGLDSNVLCGKTPRSTFLGVEKARSRNFREPVEELAKISKETKSADKI